jgi:PIN domain nuclease of toxin-antitoxin system
MIVQDLHIWPAFINDPADQIIIATAVSLNATLLKTSLFYTTE